MKMHPLVTFVIFSLLGAAPASANPTPGPVEKGAVYAAYYNIYVESLSILKFQLPAEGATTLKVEKVDGQFSPAQKKLLVDHWDAITSAILKDSTKSAESIELSTQSLVPERRYTTHFLMSWIRSELTEEEAERLALPAAAEAKVQTPHLPARRLKHNLKWFNFTAFDEIESGSGNFRIKFLDSSYYGGNYRSSYTVSQTFFRNLLKLRQMPDESEETLAVPSDLFPKYDGDEDHDDRSGSTYP
ncbi:MAG: hypothetical protein AB7P04_00335 [Bacteriovoracia bacterium]